MAATDPNRRRAKRPIVAYDRRPTSIERCNRRSVSHRKAVLDWASRKSIRQATFGSTTDLITGVGAARGRVDYQRLSGFTHSVVKSVMVGYIEIDQARRGDTGLIEVHAVVIATAAAQYVLAGLASLVRITSASQDDVTDLTAWLDDLEDQVARAAQQVDELQ